MRRLWGTCVVLGAIWLAAGLAVSASRSAMATPEKLAAFIHDNPLQAATPEHRQKIITGAAAQLNRMSFPQRYELWENGVVRDFFIRLSPEERDEFLEATFPEGSRQSIDALNKMTGAKRRELVQRALEDIRINYLPGNPARVEERDIYKAFALGVSSYHREASADVKLDFAPVLEELQRNLQDQP